MNNKYHIIQTDVLVIGSGLAGSMAAVSCLNNEQNVTVVNKGKMCWSGSTAVCGGNDIAVCFPDDDKTEWIEAFIKSSDYTADQRWIEIFLNESYVELCKLEELGKKHNIEIFPKKQDGSFWRIKRYINPFETVICNIHNALNVFSKELKESAAELYERVMVTKLLKHEDKIVGAIGFNYRTGEIYLFQAKAVILASGCCTYKADVFDVCGEGFAMAYEIGAKMMSFDRGGAIMRPKDVMRGGLLCSSSSSSMANAMGSKLRNCNGIDIEECMTLEEKKLGRAGLNKAIQRELEMGNGPVYEDFINIPEEIKKVLYKLRLAAVKRVKIEYGKDVFSEIIPMEFIEQTITPDQSNRMGGIWIDEKGQTSIKGLFAIGDVSCPKISFQHPYNGSDLGWALLSGGRVGNIVIDYCRKNEHVASSHETQEHFYNILQNVDSKIKEIFNKENGIHPDEVKAKIIQTMIPYDVNHKNEESLEKCLGKIKEIEEKYLPLMNAKTLHDLRKYIEAKSMVKTAEMIVASELYRKESRVGVRRTDYPFMDNVNWKKWVGFYNENGNMNFFTENINETLSVIPNNVTEPFVERI